MDFYDFTTGSHSANVRMVGVGEPIAIAADSQYIWILAEEGQKGILYRWDVSMSATGNAHSYVEPLYTRSQPDEQGLRQCAQRALELKDKYGFVNSSGKEVVAVKYDYIYSEDDNGWRKVEINDKKGYINDSGTEIVAPIYDYIYSWSGGLAKVEKGNKTGYINRAGKLVQPLE
jgi:hypothetical protein